MEHWRDLEIKTGLAVREKDGSLYIRPRFLVNRFNIGGLIFFALGNFFTWMAVWKTYEAFDFYFLLGIGVILTIAGVLVTMKVLTDYLFITNTEIIFRNNLKKRMVTIEPGLKVKVKAKRVKSRVRKWHKSTINVDIYVKKEGNKYRIIDFVSERVDRKAAVTLGKAIANYINRRIDVLS